MSRAQIARSSSWPRPARSRTSRCRATPPTTTAGTSSSRSRRSVATLVGVWLHKPRSKAPWYLVALSGLCAVTADALYAIELEQIGDVPFPSTADYFALGSYVVLAAALLVMIRKQVPGRDWPSLIDAGIVTVGVAIVGWTFLVYPTLTEDSSTLATTVALAFPVMDVLLVSLAARMVLGPGLRSPAFAMVTIALVFQLVGDALYGFGSLHGWYRVGDSVDLFFVVAAVLWGTAALHPSMVELTEPNPDPEQRLSGKRLAVLSAATLTAPAMLAVAAARAGSSELLVIVGAGAALSALVIVRLAGLVARHERSERREHVLGTAAAALVSAWTREDIYLVAVDAAREIVGQEDAAVEVVVDGATVAGRWPCRRRRRPDRGAARGHRRGRHARLPHGRAALQAGARGNRDARRSGRTRARKRQPRRGSPRAPERRAIPSARPELERRHRAPLARPDDPLPHAVGRARARLRRGRARRASAHRAARAATTASGSSASSRRCARCRARRCRATCRSVARTARSCNWRASSTTCSTSRTSAVSY